MSSRSPSSETAGRATPGGVAVGRILRAHGIRGEVKVEVWSDVAERFSAGRLLFPRQSLSGTGRPARPAPSAEPLRIEKCRKDRGLLLIRFEGIEDRNAAEQLHGTILEVGEEEVPEAPEGFFYFFQLVGCRVVDLKAGDLGPVTEILEDGGGHLLQVRRPDSTVLVPFVDAFLRRVDTDQRLIEVDLPEGLLESCESPS